MQNGNRVIKHDTKLNNVSERIWLNPFPAFSTREWSTAMQHNNQKHMLRQFTIGQNAIRQSVNYKY